MMQRIFKLARVFRQGAGLIGRDKAQSENKAVGSNAALTMPVVIVIVIALLGFLTYRFAETINMIGGAEMLMTVAFLVAGIIGAVLVFLELINTMYMSSDLSSLITMPLSALEIVGARIVNAARLQFGVAAIVIAPSLVGFGIATQAGILFYIVGLLGIILVPLFVLFAIALIVIFIMTFVRMFRNRDAVAIIGVILAFLAFIAYFTFVDGKTSADQIGDTVLGAMQGLSGFASIIPVAPLLVQFYVSGNFLLLLVAVGAILATLAVLIVFIKVFYFRGAIAIHSGGNSKKVIKDFSAVSKKHSVVGALTRRELYAVFRTPAFFLYGFIITLFWPVVVIIPLIFRANLGEIFSMILGMDAAGIGNGEFGTIMVAIACVLSFVISVLIVGMSNFAYNSISRDGQSFFFNKIIPVSFKEQIRAKRNAALIVSLIGTTGYTLIGTLLIIFILKLLPLWSLVPILLISAMTTLLVNNLQIWLGSRRANLDWTDEATVGKSTSVVLMIVAFACLFGVPLGLLFSLIGGVSPLVWIIGLCVISVVGAIFSQCFALRSAACRMSEM